MDSGNTGDALALVRKMWGNMGFNLPGMVVPTFDANELEKRISDLKAVEGWLRMNLSMLQMTIRSLEMQKTTIDAVRAMGEMATDAADKAAETIRKSTSETAEAVRGATETTPSPQFPGPDQEGGMWPWMLMQQVQEYMQRQAAAAAAMTGHDQSAEPTSDKESTKR